MGELIVIKNNKLIKKNMREVFLVLGVWAMFLKKEKSSHPPTQEGKEILGRRCDDNTKTKNKSDKIS